MSFALRHRQPEGGFERLYRAHVGDVYRYALAVTGNQADAEDVAQTTFMNAYRAFARGERPAKPHNWLIAIAHNVCRERFRQAARRPAQVEFDEDVAEALVPDRDAPSAADLQRALGQLALNQREALVMRELEGRSYAEIADVLGLTVAAVETLLFRARRALREQLEGTLTCSQAEAALSLQLDGRLPRRDAGALRAHLRACEECSRLARRQRAQRKAFRALAVVPLPASLGHWGGGGAAGTAAGAGAAGSGAAGVGSAGLSTGIALKAAAVVAGVAVAGGGYAVARHEAGSPSAAPPAAAAAGGVDAARTGLHASPRRKAAAPKLKAVPASSPRAATLTPAAGPRVTTAASTTVADSAPAATTATTTASASPPPTTAPHTGTAAGSTTPASTRATPAHQAKKTKKTHRHVAPHRKGKPASCRRPGQEHAAPCGITSPGGRAAGKRP